MELGACLSDRLLAVGVHPDVPSHVQLSAQDACTGFSSAV
jgi:hypothetical protein